MPADDVLRSVQDGNAQSGADPGRPANDVTSPHASGGDEHKERAGTLREEVQSAGASPEGKAVERDRSAAIGPDLARRSNIADNHFNISDANFMEAVRFIRGFRTFLLEDAKAKGRGLAIFNRIFVSDRADASEGWETALRDNFCTIALYIEDSLGRKPFQEDWRIVEEVRSYLFMEYSNELIRYGKFQPPYLVKRLPYALLLLATAGLLMSLIGLAIDPGPAAATLKVLGVVAWMLAIAGLGGVAFLAVNLLGMQMDNNVDLTNGQLARVRLAVGVVFGFVLALTISLPATQGFLSAVYKFTTSTQSDSSMNLTQAVQVLLPFVFGFSTSLVLTVMGRLVASVETIFGVTPKPSIARK